MVTRGSPTTGLTLVEVLVAMVLAGVVATAAGRMLVDHLQALEGLVARAEAEESERITVHLLEKEIRAGRSGPDWGPVEEERVLPVRSFRGLARVCSMDPGEGTVTVAYRGGGTLESERDSVLVLPSEEAWRAVGVERLGEAPDTSCPLPGTGGDPPEIWRVDPFVEDPVVLRPFRHTVYHLADGALRMEQAGAGRQPLTPERIGDGASMSREGPLLRLNVQLDPGPLGAPWLESRALRSLEPEVD